LSVQTSVTTALQGAMPLGMTDVGSDEFGGFLLAFVIGVTAIGASLPIGILLALGRQSDMLLIKTLCVGFIEFVRGVPLITVLFTATLLLGYFLPPQTNFDVVLRVIILVTFFSAAYLAEVIRGGLAALPKGQYEAADALGLDYWQAQRLIVMPQALKVSIPGIVSTFIGLFKDTTLVAFVGLMDPLKGVTTIVRADTAWKGIYWEPYIFVGAIFFAVCFGMSRYSMYLEQKLKTDHR
jgi:general L-amino acid transport system permease protein